MSEVTEVTHAYLLGIKEGRAYVKQFGAQTRAEIERHIENLKAVKAMYNNGNTEMRQSLNGQIDFWAHQLKGVA